MISLVEKALRIATKAHEGQVRKEGEVLYIVHPVMCALMLTQYGFTDEVVATALVHDVLEDTSVSEADLRRELGDRVTDAVTKLSENKSLVWEDRKKEYIENVRNADELVKAVSLADKIHNAQSLLHVAETRESNVWSAFNRGKEAKLWFENEMLAMFKNTWKHQLIEEYELLIRKLEKI